MMFGGNGPQSSLDFLKSLRLGLAYSRQSYQQKFVENRFYNARDLFRFDMVGHYSCVNALDVSKDHAYLASGGDCMRVLIWDLDRAFCSSNYRAAEMKTKHESNIFSVAFTPDKRTLFSGGNDGMIIAHDPQTGEVIRSCELPWQVISSISVNPHQPNLCMVATCDSFINGITGHSRGNGVYQFDLRTPWRLENMVSPDISVVGAPHCVQYNPVRPHCIATADSKHGLLQWDLRELSNYEMRYEYDGPSDQGLMSLAWSSNGMRIASLPKRDCPRLYFTDLASPAATFSAKGFANGCTLKSVTFAGPNEEYVVTGSDSFQVYMWRHDTVSHPDSTPYDAVNIKDSSLTLSGHRSIVNQVRYCPRHYCLFSSGVEKMIKVWSIFSSPRAQGSLTGRDRAPQRKRREPRHLNSLPMIGQIASDSVEEDPLMLMFFDRLLYEDDTTDSSGDESDLDGGFAEILRRQFSPGPESASNDSSDENSSGENNDSSSVNANNNRYSKSSNSDVSSPSSVRNSVKRPHLACEDSGRHKRLKLKISKSKCVPDRSCALRGTTRKRNSSCDDKVDDVEQPTTSKIQRLKRKLKSHSDSSSDSSISSSIKSDSLSSLSSLSSPTSSSSSSSACHRSTKRFRTSSIKSDQNTSMKPHGPPKNLRPSFRLDESDESIDDG